MIISQCSRLLGSGQQRIHPPRADAHLKMQCFSLLVLILEVLAWADKGDALNRQLILYISDVGSGYICEKKFGGSSGRVLGGWYTEHAWSFLLDKARLKDRALVGPLLQHSESRLAMCSSLSDALEYQPVYHRVGG